MKVSLSLLFVFFSITLFGQSKESQSAAADTSAIRHFKGTVCYNSRNNKKKYYPLVVVDGRRSTRHKLKKLNAETITIIQIIKDEQTLASFGSAGKYGVILITTNRSDKQKKI